MERVNVAFVDTSITRVHAMTLKFKTYMMDLEHTMAEHIRVISGLVHDLNHQ